MDASLSRSATWAAPIASGAVPYLLLSTTRTLEPPMLVCTIWRSVWLEKCANPCAPRGAGLGGHWLGMNGGGRVPGPAPVASAAARLPRSTRCRPSARPRSAPSRRCEAPGIENASSRAATLESTPRGSPLLSGRLHRSGSFEDLFVAVVLQVQKVAPSAPAVNEICRLSRPCVAAGAHASDVSRAVVRARPDWRTCARRTARRRVRAAADWRGCLWPTWRHDRQARVARAEEKR